MLGRTGHLDLDKETVSPYTSCGPQTNPADLDYPPWFSPLPPPHWQSAFLWIMAHLSHCRLLTLRRLSLQDYVDFMLRARWKLYQHTRRPRFTGRYLDVIEWPQYWSEVLGSHPPPTWYLITLSVQRFPRLDDFLYKPMCLVLVFFVACIDAPHVRQ